MWKTVKKIKKVLLGVFEKGIEYDVFLPSLTKGLTWSNTNIILGLKEMSSNNTSFVVSQPKKINDDSFKIKHHQKKYTFKPLVFSLYSDERNIDSSLINGIKIPSISNNMIILVSYSSEHRGVVSMNTRIKVNNKVMVRLDRMDNRENLIGGLANGWYGTVHADDVGNIDGCYIITAEKDGDIYVPNTNVLLHVVTKTEVDKQSPLGLRGIFYEAL